MDFLQSSFPFLMRVSQWYMCLTAIVYILWRLWRRRTVRITSTSSSQEDKDQHLNGDKPQVVPLSNSLFKLYGPSPPDTVNVDIFFFHGFQKESESKAYLSTWTSGDARKEVWPQSWLPVRFPRAQILLASYDASVTTTDTEGRMDLYQLGESLMIEILSVCTEQRNHCPIILVGHSFGGLVIKQLCSHAYRSKDSSSSGFLERIGGIFFYATPHLGMDSINLGDSSVIRTNERLLKFVPRLSTEAARLQSEFDQPRKQYGWKIYGVGEAQVPVGEHVLVVPEASSRLGIDHFLSVQSDHYSICKPVSETCIQYQHLVNLIDIVCKDDQEQGRKLQKLRGSLVGWESLLVEAQTGLEKHVILGFCGMGGVGKTTMAKLVFETLRSTGTFEYTGFVDSVKLIKGNAKEIKEIAGTNICRHGKPISRSRETNINVWMEVREKKLLLVFDDIEFRHVDLLKKIVEDHDSEESRFIVTSRDEGLLRFLDGIHICKVSMLEPKFAKELFMAHAFPGLKEAPEGLKDQVDKVVQGCAGLPLTLEIMGKYFKRGRRKEVWDETSDALRKADKVVDCLENGVWAKLRLSFDDLPLAEQEMFLDVASFLLHEDCHFSFEEVKSAWSSMFGSVHTRWQTLMERSLVQEEEIVIVGSCPSDTARLAVDAERVLFAEEYPDGVVIRKVKMHEHLRGLGERIAEERGRCFVTSNLLGGALTADNFSRLTNIVTLRANINPGGVSSQGGEDHGEDNPCGLCKMQRIFLHLKAIRYMELTIPDSICCQRCNAIEGICLPSSLRMFHWSGFSVAIKLPMLQVDSSCKTLVVLNLDRQDPCSRDILSTQTWRSLPDLERLFMTCKDTSLPENFGELQRLSRLEIHSENIKELPQSFSNLSSLLRLSLDNCVELEMLPESIGNLCSLVNLSLRRCKKLPTLPKSIGSLSRLEKLNLERCDELEDLPESFGNLSGLEELTLGGSKKLKTLPSSFGNLSNLQKLDLHICCELETLPENFGNLTKLGELSLYDCQELARLPESFGNLSTLVHLSLGRSKKLQTLPESFGTLSRLEKLHIIQFTELERLPDSFGNLFTLLELRLIECGKLQSLPESFGNLSRLKKLCLADCEEMEKLPASFGDLTDLECLSLIRCRKLETLPDSFGKLSGLKELDLRGCHTLKTLPKSFGNLSSLVDLGLDECKELETLPESFGDLSRLEKLGLTACEELTMLCESFGNLSALVDLSLGGCEKLRTLPESFGKLSKLRGKLSLDDCEELQKLPESFGNLTALVSLNLDACNKLKTLPESLENLSMLRKLTLDGCGELETLPESIGNLSALEHLGLEGCEKLRNLPESLGKLSMLKILRLDGCVELECLPKSFKNISSLIYLSSRGCKKLQPLLDSLENLSRLKKSHMGWVWTM